MTASLHIDAARAALVLARQDVQNEMRAYPTPISGCDAQYNYLVGLSGSIADALASLEGPNFVATPRTPDRYAGVESR